MAQVHNDELEYMVDDYYDMDGFNDNPFEGVGEQMNGDNTDVEDHVDMNKQKTDTSAEEARNGKDIQGIPWERLNFTRNKYRQTRLKQYKNYENLSRSRVELEKECKQVENGSTFYDFQFNTRIVKPTVVHFQTIPMETNAPLLLASVILKNLKN